MTIPIGRTDGGQDRDREARRRAVTETVLARAREDDRIVAAAVTGSAARDAADRWSDVDLFFGVADGAEVTEVVAAWSAFAYRELGALHHFDLHAGPAAYRAFLLDGLLEIDLGFTPAASFGPVGDGAFRVVFGTSAARRSTPADPAHLVGLAWHHVLHARSGIDRELPWQAEHWIGALREHTLALACLRLGLPAGHAKGADRLPTAVTEPLRDTLVRGLDAAELSRALRAVTRALLRELRATDAATAERLAPALRELAELPDDA